MRFSKRKGAGQGPGAAGRQRALVAVIVAAGSAIPCVSRADVQSVTQTGGPPQLPIPMFEETGLPDFTMLVGRPTLPPAGGNPTGSGGGDPGAGDPAGGGSGGTSADAVLQQRSWGAMASQNVTAMGVNPSVIAAACVIESGCQNVNALSGSSVSGAFQMIDQTYTADIRQAAAQNPSLAGTIDTSLAGKLDPANQAIAAAQELKNAATTLQRAGISNPTFLDTRGAYNFGGLYGVPLATANDGQMMSSILTSYTASQLASNGISPSTTVGQWRQSVINKIGPAATQPILLRS